MEKEQKTRIITAACAIPIFLLLVILGGWFLGIALLLIAILGCGELWRMVERIPTNNRPAWILGGCGYILLGFLAFFGVRHLQGALWLLLIVWSTDTAAYELGRRFGKTKLAPAVSPNKTVEGALAGVGGGLLIGFLFGIIFVKVSVASAIIIPIFISVVGQIGDLLESKVKRLAGVKDSGKLLPGHGGVLDRFDSLLLSAPFMYIFLLICK